MTTTTLERATPAQMTYLKALVEDHRDHPVAQDALRALMAGGISKTQASFTIDELRKLHEASATLMPVPQQTVLPMRVDLLPQKGTYTVVGKREHRTLRFSAGGGPLDGKVVISFRDGHQYRPFAHVDRARGLVRVWKGFGGREDLQAAVRFLASTSRQTEAGKAYAMESRRCFRCDRALTTPESISVALGPECRKREARRTG